MTSFQNKLTGIAAAVGLTVGLACERKPEASQLNASATPAVAPNAVDLTALLQNPEVPLDPKVSGEYTFHTWVVGAALRDSVANGKLTEAQGISFANELRKATTAEELLQHSDAVLPAGSYENAFHQHQHLLPD